MMRQREANKMPKKRQTQERAQVAVHGAPHRDRAAIFAVRACFLALILADLRLCIEC